MIQDFLPKISLIHVNYFRHEYLAKMLTPTEWTREDMSHWINETVDLRILSRSGENHDEYVVIDRKLYIGKHGPVIPFLEIQKKVNFKCRPPLLPLDQKMDGSIRP
jgi:hypothetical protein